MSAKKNQIGADTRRRIEKEKFNEIKNEFNINRKNLKPHQMKIQNKKIVFKKINNISNKSSVNLPQRYNFPSN